MGVFYSHIVFQPPSPPTYKDCNGEMTFRKARFDHSSDDDDNHAEHDNSNPDSLDQEYVSHRLLFLNTLRGSTIPAAYFHQPDSYYTILFSHGNGEDLGVTASYALELSNSLKTSVLCYDYTGYGLNNTKPTEAHCYADIRAAYTYLISERRIPPKRIVLFGRSLGSGPTVDLAVSLGRNLGGVVLIAALTSCVRVVFNNTPHTMKFDMFANVDKIARIDVPLFCVHGMLDDVVPFSHGVELSRRAKYPLEPLWIRAAGHNNLESTRFQYEVFLRYMKVLQEFRRWKPPKEPEMIPVPRRRESLGALGKVAGCFGPQRSKDDNELRSRSTRRRAFRGTSSSHLMFNKALTEHEVDLNALWSADSEDKSMLTGRCSAATVRSSKGFEDREAIPLARSVSKASLSSGCAAAKVDV